MANMSKVPDAIDADYTLWTANTIVELHSVPWNNDYKDIVDWDTTTKRRLWFENRPSSTRTRIEGVQYARITEPIRIELPFTTAYRYNYVRVINGREVPTGNQQTEYFYFVTGIAHTNPGVTTITVQLDVWTTFGLDANFGKAYVERGHLGIANENNFGNFGRDFLTVPEGMDIGNEYQIVYAVSHDVMHKVDNQHDDTNIQVMIASTIDFESSGGTISEPKLATAKGDNVQGLPSGAQYYIFPNITDFQRFMLDMKDKPWMTQGIISITAVPDVYRYGGRTTTAVISGTKVGVQKLNMPRGSGLTFKFVNNWRDSNRIYKKIPYKYRKLKKFYTFPYMVLEMTNYAGNSVIMKPELWNDPDAWTSEKAVFAAPNQRIVHHPIKYNAFRGSTIVDRDYDTVFNDTGEYLNAGLVTANLPTFAIVNNGYLAFMAGNAHGINQQYQTADWSQQKALEGSRVSYDQANNSIQTGAANAGTARDLAADQNWQTNRTAVTRAIFGAGAQLGGAAASGPAGLAAGGLGVLSGAANAGLDVANRNAMQGLSNTAAVNTQRNTQANQQYLADTNKTLAQWSARGDYATSIASINARVQDAQLTQPSTSGAAGGDVFNLIHGGMAVTLKFKMLSYGNMCMIGDYWLRYGYAIQRFVTMDKLNVMTNFTYWKLSELYLVNTYLPEFIKQAIRGIFEKGVTVHRDPLNIGVIDIGDNEPLDGIVIAVDELPVDLPDDPDPIIPNPDEEDEMYLVSTVGTTATYYWMLGKEYANLTSVSNSGTSVPKKLVGTDFTALSSTEFVNALRSLKIPTKYNDVDVFTSENPSGVWSKDTENAGLINAMQDSIDANAVTLTAILQKLDNPDTGGTE